LRVVFHDHTILSLWRGDRVDLSGFVMFKGCPSGRYRGFTLIELLVVIGIIGVLSSIAVVSFSGVRERARDTKRVSDITSIQKALALYESTEFSYPSSGTFAVGWRLGEEDTACLGVEGFGVSGCAEPFMLRVPADPQPDKFGRGYLYKGFTDSTEQQGCPNIACHHYRIVFHLDGPVGDLNPEGRKGRVCVATPGALECRN
jgi:prepilin-type N-terminal cleavage/methylation domain-containing protein